MDEICDRDAKWNAPVRERLGEAGIRVVQTPFRAPNATCTAHVVSSAQHLPADRKADARVQLAIRDFRATACSIDR